MSNTVGPFNPMHKGLFMIRNVDTRAVRSPVHPDRPLGLRPGVDFRQPPKKQGLSDFLLKRLPSLKWFEGSKC